MAGRARKTPGGRATGPTTPAESGGATPFVSLDMRTEEGRWASLQEVHDELRYGRSEKQNKALFGRLRCIKQAAEMAADDADRAEAREIMRQLEAIKRLRKQGTGALLTLENAPSLPGGGGAEPN